MAQFPFHLNTLLTTMYKECKKMAAKGIQRNITITRDLLIAPLKMLYSETFVKKPKKYRYVDIGKKLKNKYKLSSY